MNTTFTLPAFTAQLERHIQKPMRPHEYDLSSEIAQSLTDSVDLPGYRLFYTLNRRPKEPAYVCIVDPAGDGVWDGFVRRTWLMRCLYVFHLPQIRKAGEMA